MPLYSHSGLPAPSSPFLSFLLSLPPFSPLLYSLFSTLFLFWFLLSLLLPFLLPPPFPVSSLLRIQSWLLYIPGKHTSTPPLGYVPNHTFHLSGSSFRTIGTFVLGYYPPWGNSNTHCTSLIKIYRMRETVNKNLK